MKRKNLIIAIVLVVVVALGVVLLVPRDSGYDASASKKPCTPSYGYDKKNKPCKPKHRPLLYDILNIGE